MKPVRYTIDDDYPEAVYVHEQGHLVDWDDYAALAAENERLRSYINEIECIGDDLAGMVGHADVTGDAHQMMLELYDAWNAAKEGRDAK